MHEGVDDEMSETPQISCTASAHLLCISKECLFTLDPKSRRVSLKSIEWGQKGDMYEATTY